MPLLAVGPLWTLLVPQGQGYLHKVRVLREALGVSMQWVPIKQVAELVAFVGMVQWDT